MGHEGVPRIVRTRTATGTAYCMTVALWDKVRGGGAPQKGDGPAMDVDLKAVRTHFRTFITDRRGVEAYVEPATSVTATTVVLVAADGEWTRRAVGSRDRAFALSRDLGVPVYDVNLTGSPARMREWTSRQRRAESDD